MTHSPFWLSAVTLLERRPSLGYLGASVPTATGFWVLVEQATKLGALCSILIGIAVGVVTLRVQLRALRAKESKVRGAD